MSFTIDYLTLDKFSPDPVSPEDGDLWYNESSDTIKIHAESITRFLVDDILFTTHSGSLLNPHQVTKTQVGLGNVTDDSQLLRAGNDFTLFPEKPTISGTDYILIEDSEDSGNKKKVKLSSLPSSGISEPVHQGLDTLVHDISEDFFEEITYTGFKVTNVTDWTDFNKTIKIREQIFTYSGFRVDTATTIQYDGAGVEVERLEEQFGYTGFKVTTISGTRTP